MAHSKTNDPNARLIEQCAQGRKLRYIYSIPFIAAEARTNMTGPNHILADGIQDTTVNKAIFVAPCAGKITRVYANALTYATCAAGGTVKVKATKTVIGTTDVDLCSTITVSGEAGSVPTADTAIDATLSTTSGALNLVEGQLVYGIMVISNYALTARTSALQLCIEYVPMEQ